MLHQLPMLLPLIAAPYIQFSVLSVVAMNDARSVRPLVFHQLGKSLLPRLLTIPRKVDDIQQFHLVCFEGAGAVLSSLVDHPRGKALVLRPIQRNIGIAKSLPIRHELVIPLLPVHVSFGKSGG